MASIVRDPCCDNRPRSRCLVTARCIAPSVNARLNGSPELNILDCKNACLEVSTIIDS